MSRPSRPSTVATKASPGLYGIQQIIQARPLRHGPCDDVLVEMYGGDANASDAHPLFLQRVGSAVPATGYPGVTVDRHICYLVQAGCRKRGLTTPKGLLMSLLPMGEGTFPTIKRPSHRPSAALHHGQHPKSAGPGESASPVWTKPRPAGPVTSTPNPKRITPGYVDRGASASVDLHGQTLQAAALRAGERLAGPAAIRTAKPFPLLKGGMHYAVCHCHAPR